MLQKKDNMPCPQDADLIRAGLAIDAFPTWAKDVIISHAHGDHIRGIETSKPKHIMAHRITCELLRPRYPQHYYHPMDYYAGICLLSGIDLVLIPSTHIPGACMILLDSRNRTRRILYTSDFRFADEYRQDRFLELIHQKPIHTIYMDDTYSRVSRRFPTTDETLASLAQLVQMNPHVKTWAVSAKTIGVECLVSRLGQIQIDEQVPEWRKTQLLYLLPDRSETKTNGPTFKLVWDSRRHPYQGQNPLIKCITFPFINNHDMILQLDKDRFAVFYATHTNAEETARFCSLVNPQFQISLCGDENE